MSDESPATEPQAATPVDENQIVAERREKLAKLRELGPAYPNDFSRTNIANYTNEIYGQKPREALEEEKVDVVIGRRMMLKRVMGRASFAALQDASGRIQLFISNDDAGEAAHAA